MVDRGDPRADIHRVNGLSLSLLLSSVAMGQTRVAIVEVRADDQAGPESVAAASDAIRNHLAAAGHDVLAATAVTQRLARHEELRGCTSARCLDRAAEVLEVERLLGATIRRTRTSLGVDVWLYDPSVHLSVVGKESCTNCASSEVARVATAAVGDAMEKDARRFVPANVDITSAPSGATVRMDGRAEGLTPLRLRVPPGSHGLSLSKDGFATQSRDFEAVGGETLELHLTLEPTNERGLWPGHRWIALAGALVAVGLGGVWLAIDGNDVGAAGGPIEGREIRDTRTGGIVFLGVGVALGATGAALWWFE